LAGLKVRQWVYHTGANLLSATFTGGAIVGQAGTTGGSSAANTGEGDTIVYTSDFLSFGSITSRDFALTLSSVIPNISFVPNQALNSFNTKSSGAFSSDPAPVLTAPVPEPASWMLLAAGCGFVFRGRARARRVIA